MRGKLGPRFRLGVLVQGKPYSFLKSGSDQARSAFLLCICMVVYIYRQYMQGCIFHILSDGVIFKAADSLNTRVHNSVIRTHLTVN
jgi:hypothetical protein